VEAPQAAGVDDDTPTEPVPIIENNPTNFSPVEDTDVEMTDETFRRRSISPVDTSSGNKRPKRGELSWLCAFT